MSVSSPSSSATRGYLARVVIAISTLSVSTLVGSSVPPRSVLHIVVDDLRPELGIYGLPDRHTPNIDRLASQGTVFDRAYCQQAICGPSRNSFMTGRYPDRSRTWNFINHFREDHPEWTTLPGLFKNSGRLALGSGKVFHPKMPPAYDSDQSWSSEVSSNLPFRNPCWNTADFKRSRSCEKESPASATCDGGLPCVFCPVDVESHIPFLHVETSIGNEFCEIDAYEDVLTIDHAISLLRRAKTDGRPFYLAVGLHKPHMPWMASRKDFEAHPIDSIDLASNPSPPSNVPPIALHSSDNSLHASPWIPVSNVSARAARRAYRAAVTGMDRKLGKLLDALRDFELESSTAVVFMGDHGWSLGEHGEWRKMTNFEETTRVPLVVKVPWLNADETPPARSSAIVELVDVLPTIAELAGIELPANETFDGKSFADVLKGRSATGARTDALSCYPRKVSDPEKAWKNNGVIHSPRETFTHMGYTIRTEDWRYTEWFRWNQSSLRAISSEVVATELYDHRNVTAFPTDFGAAENANVAGDDAYADVERDMSARLRHRVFGEGESAG